MEEGRSGELEGNGSRDRKGSRREGEGELRPERWEGGSGMRTETQRFCDLGNDAVSVVVSLFYHRRSA